MCDVAERSRLVEKVEADLRAAKRAEKDELEKDRIKIFMQLGKRSWQRLSFRRFRNFLLLTGNSDIDPLFWTTDEEAGVCHEKKRVLIAYEDEDGEYENPIKEYDIRREKTKTSEEESEA